jgi:uncharacterized protein YrrD
MNSAEQRNSNVSPAPRADAPDTIDYLTMLDAQVIVPHAHTRREQTVRGVKIDFESQRVLAVLVSEDGQPRWQVRLPDVRSVDADQVRVANRDSLQPRRYGGGRNVFGASDGLIGADVVFEDTSHKGKVRTFRFHLPGGTIAAYEISRGLLRNLFAGRAVVTRDRVISASPEEIIVSSTPSSKRDQD